MKPATIAHAGCDKEIIRKLDLVRELAAGKGRKLTVRFWAGTGVDLAVVDPSDAFGQRAMEIALRHQIPTLLVANNKDYDRSTVLKTRMLSANMSAFHFYEAIEAALPDARRETVSASHTDPFWEMLLGEENYLTLRHGAHEIWVNRVDGYCLARTHRAATAVATAANAAVDLEVKPVPALPNLGGGERTSIENFFFNALLGHQSLPDQKGFRFTLTSWPDIRCDQADTTQAITGLAATAMGQRCDAETLYQRVDPALVEAFLMACRIAGIAETQSGDTGGNHGKKSASAEDKSSGLVSALGRWLGLGSSK